MKIDLTKIDSESFMVHPHVVNDETAWLIQPCHIGTKWNSSNKILRSCLTDADGNIISLGFPKFVNWGENPDNFPVPHTLKNSVCMDKLDGSLLIVSKYKGKFILRTRGTSDASKMDNGHELEVFKQKYAKVFDFQPHFETWPFSILFEWTTPLNRIVIRYGDEPEFSLVGGVYHDNGKLWTQDYLDDVAKGFGCPRPIRYSFGSISDLLTDIDAWQGREGVCVYSNDDQTIHKCKSMWYLTRHRLKEELNNIEKIVDLFIQEKSFDYTSFMEKIVSVLDWETANEIRGDVSRVCDAYKEVQLINNHMKMFVEPLRRMSRKDAAQKIISSYSNTNRASFCFSILDGKELTSDQLKKLLWQCLKK